ncbi:MAG: lipopolysaccharide heptosyltransferase II [Candidatus Latescibacterota bacterium]|nr:MAG: lipopolysaccharide heptosyltransferase II [Candidatus Latescibacterota bacterium]
MSSKIRNILFAAPTWLGDAVMSLPLLGFLGAAAGVRIIVLARSYAARVYWGLEDVAELIVAPADSRLGRVTGLRGVVKKTGADAAVILAPSFSQALSVFVSGTPVRVGFRSEGRGPFLTHALATRGLRDEHLFEYYMRLGRLLLSTLDVAAPDTFDTPRVRVFGNERERLARVLDTVGLRRGGYIVTVPGATFGPTKTWPVDKYRRLVDMITTEIPVVLGGSAAERELCEEIADGVPRAHNLAGDTGLGEFIALLEGARVVVANDSGAPHVAASLGIPVVVIFGSTSPTWTAPLGAGSPVEIVRAPVKCAPCFLKTCPTHLECYEGISPEMVLAAVQAALKKTVEKSNPS